MAAAVQPKRSRHRWHAPEKGSGPAFGLSLLAHAVLFIAIAFMVRWKSEPVGTVSAELWNLPPAVQPPPAPPPLIPPKVEQPPPEPPRKADIVEEKKASKIEQKKELPPKKEKLDPPKKVEAKTEPAAKPPDPNAAIQRALAQAGKSPASASSGGGFSDRYAAQVITCIRPHIIFNVPDAVRPQQYVAEFEVTLLPTGEQATDPKLIKASGLAPYDQAVERAIRRCNPFPPPKEGTMPRSVRLSFDPVETR